jgi:hypothetical protein
VYVSSPPQRNTLVTQGCALFGAAAVGRSEVYVRPKKPTPLLPVDCFDLLPSAVYMRIQKADEQRWENVEVLPAWAAPGAEYTMLCGQFSAQHNEMLLVMSMVSVGRRR